MSTTTQHPVLEKICAENSVGVNGILGQMHQHPFGIDIALPPAGRWDAAISGAVVLAFAGGALDRCEICAPNVERIISNSPRASHWCTMADLREWAGADDGVRKNRLGRDYLPGDINGYRVNRCLLAGLIADLPGDLIAIGIKDQLNGIVDVVYLYGAGWVLAVAGLRMRPDSRDALRLDVHELPGYMTTSQCDHQAQEE